MAWEGVFKIVEETGELLQLLGKLGPFPDGQHPDGKGDLRLRIEDELADVMASILWIAAHNGFDAEKLHERTEAKIRQYNAWDGIAGMPGVSSKRSA